MPTAASPDTKTENAVALDEGSSSPERAADGPLPFDAQSFLKSLPLAPGVYRMFERRGQVIYVGKAKVLKKRVASYFRPPEQLDAKTRALMANMHRMEVTVTHTETEALLLENNLIKEHRPRYNIVLRDDKSFPYIYVSTHQAYPRLSFHRGARSKQGRYFGPYASAGAVRETLAQLQKLFQVRQCRDSYFANRSRPCLQYQIKRCTAPCVGKVSESEYAGDVRHAVMFLEGKSEEMIGELVGRMESAAARLEYELAGRYRDQIASLRRVQSAQYVSGTRGNVDVVAACARDGAGVVQLTVIRGGHSLGSRTIVPRHASGANTDELLRAFLPQHYLSKGAQASLPDEILLSEPVADLELFEEALSAEAGRKLRLRTQSQVRGDRARWLQMARENAELAVAQRLADRGNVRARFEALQDALGFDEMPERLECFDISHTSGEATVASCVVFGLEGATKSDYRRFNIRDVAAGDDYAAMRQALQRRYTRLKREEGKLPDVLLIDGGKGQVAEARQVLEDLQLGDVPIVGVAKGVTRKPGLETLIVPGRKYPVALASDSPALHLIQQVRDEAHRFAITGHRARRSKARKSSVLEHIPGVGAARRQRLLAEFGGLQGLARAGIEDLERVNGISRSLAQAIYEAFRESP